MLLEAPFPKQNANQVFLTIDLTMSVLEECLTKHSDVSVIVAYHPPLFKSMKRLCLNDEKQKIALICAAKGISVYSPHTSLDNCAFGINDWLAEGLGAGQTVPITPHKSGDEFPGAGSGRIHTLNDPVSIHDMVQRIKRHLKLDHVRLATVQHSAERDIKTIAICAGSGSSVLNGVAADLYLTGEMSHHEVLAAVSSGVK